MFVAIIAESKDRNDTKAVYVTNRTTRIDTTSPRATYWRRHTIIQRVRNEAVAVIVDRVTRIFYAIADRRASLIGFANKLMAEHTLNDHYRSIEALRVRGNRANFPIYKWLCVLIHR